MAKATATRTTPTLVPSTPVEPEPAAVQTPTPPPAATNTRRRLTDEEHAEILRMAAERVPSATIAERIGTSYATVLNHLKAAGLGGKSRTTTAPLPSPLSPLQLALIEIGAAAVQGIEPPAEKLAAAKELFAEKIAAARAAADAAYQAALAQI